MITKLQLALSRLLFPRFLRMRIMNILSSALLFVWIGVEIGATTLIYQTERLAWQGRQREAAQSASRTIADFIENKKLTLNLVDYLGQVDPSNRTEILDKIMLDDPILREIVYLDRNAKILNSVSKDQPVLADLFTLRLSRWFQETSHGKGYVGSVQVSSSNNPYLILAAPTSDQKVVAARLQMDIIWNVVQEIHFGRSGRVYLTDREGRIIAHTDPTMIFKYASVQDRPEFRAVVEATDNSWSGEYQNFTGARVVGVSTSIPGTEWIIFTELPQSEAYESSLRTFVYLFIGMILLMLAVIRLSRWFIDRSVGAPIEALSMGVQKISEGDLEYQIDLPVQDEIGQVARAFNTMAGHLKLKYSELEGRNRENARLYALAQQELAERKRAEEDLRNAHAELEIRVSERTADLARANRALRESEERYSLAIQGANDGLWDWDILTGAVYFSPRCKSILGFSNPEIGENIQEWMSTIHPEDLPLVTDNLNDHLQGMTPYFSCEYRGRMPDGKYCWILVRGTAVRDSARVPYRMAGSVTDINYRKMIEKSLRKSATHDPLTGLPNRALFLDKLTHAFAPIRRKSDFTTVVLFLDVDHFKDVNDSLGHPIGDLLLIEVGKRLLTCVRAGDTVARFGGDEFAILLEDVSDIQEAVQIANRIQQNLTSVFELKRNNVFVSASIGIAQITDHHQTPEELLRDADAAMYRAKANGKARYEIFDIALWR
jgi:diguanylate cyclase (GGDEF)-like protein/PAS domain S-box-containing protein